MKHRIHPKLVPLAVEIATLTPDPRNARNHDERNVAGIMDSYADSGQRKPIVVQLKADDGTANVIRAGNGQAEAARRLGWTHIAAIVVDEDDRAAIAFAIRDNRTAELAEWNLANLGGSLDYLQGAGVPLESVGWTSAEAEPLIAADWEPKKPDDSDKYTPPDKSTRSIKFDLDEWSELQELIGTIPTVEALLAMAREWKERRGKS